jgi:integrase
LKEAGYRLQHLDAFYRGWRLANIDGGAVAHYIAHRQGEGAANGTVNREVSVLVSMLRLAVEHNKLLRLPTVHKPKEAAPRSGFFELEQYEAVRRRLPEDLQTAVAIAHTFGWRTQSEVLTLTRAQVDLEAGAIRLDPGTTKNDDGRVVYMTPELHRRVAAQLERVRKLEREMGAIIPWLFPHLGKRLQGARRIDYRDSWKTACQKTGVSGRLRHDLRRTAVRNLVNAGVSERVAMTITGHRTRAVFDRYHIVSPADLKAAAQKLAGTITGTIG